MSEPFATRSQVYDFLDQETPDAAKDRLIDFLREDIHSRFERALEFVYARDVQTRPLDGRSDPKLWLPGFGADTIQEVTEAGEVLDVANYELDPEHGRYLTRLDDDGLPINWARGRRNITVEYVPVDVPPAIRGAEAEEVARSFGAVKAAFMDRSGGDGGAAVHHTGTFSLRTYDTLATFNPNLRRR